MADGSYSTTWLDDDDLHRALTDPSGDVTAVRRAAIALWRRTVERPGGELTPDEQIEAGQWLRSMGVDPRTELLVTPGLSGGPTAVPRWAFFPDLSAKVNTISQRACRVCPTAPPESPWFQAIFRTRPDSRQSVTGAHIADLRERIAKHAGDRYGALKSRSLCVSLTFVLAAGRRERIDVDNMAKTMLDALRGTVYDDDSQIQHLDLMKLRLAEDNEEWVAARIRPTAIDMHADVFDGATHHKFGVNAI